MVANAEESIRSGKTNGAEKTPQNNPRECGKSKGRGAYTWSCQLTAVPPNATEMSEFLVESFHSGDEDETATSRSRLGREER
jgi:hypothetical protein